MENEMIQEENKYKFIKDRLEEYKISTLQSLNILDKIIIKLQKNGDSICINNYLKDVKNIRNNINTNRNKIINILMPAIEEKLQKITEESMIGDEIQ